MKLYLVRHGHTTLNQSGAADRFCGITDIPLSNQGHSQARELGCVLSGKNITYVYHSGLKRSLETANVVLETLRNAGTTSIELRLCEGIREVSFGDWEGKTKDEVHAQNPELFANWLRKPATTVIPGARSFSHRYSKALAAISGLVNSHLDESVVLIGHSTMNRLLLVGLLGADLNRYRSIRQENCAVNILEFQPDSNVVFHKMNCTSI